MGLLSRFGKNLMGTFPRAGSTGRGEAWSAGDLAGFTGINTVLGAGLGTMFGDGRGPEGSGEFASRGEGVLNGAMNGAMIGGLGTLGPAMATKIIRALAMTLKQQAPQMPDELVLQQARKLTQNPTPEVQQFIQRVLGQDGGGM